LLLITGGRVLDPAGGLDGRMNVLVSGNRIEALLDPSASVSNDVERLDAAGMIVAPGFVDIHAHLRYPGLPHKETIASGTAAAVRGGFTTVCAMANSKPAVDTPQLVEDVLRQAECEAHCRVHTFAGVSEELKGNRNTMGADLFAAGAIGLSDDGNPVRSEDIMREALEQSSRHGKPVSAHEESHHEAEDFRWPCSGEVHMIRRDVELLKSTGGRLHIAHVSCRESLDVIAAAKAAGLSITAEATPHHLALTEQVWEGEDELPANHGLAKVNPPLRSPQDVWALTEALEAGIVDAIATDHAPHAVSEKCVEPSCAAFGFSALELALPLLLQLVEAGKLSLATMVERLTAGPARIMQLHAGSLVPGAQADICLFDPNCEWTPARDTIVSKGKNHPLMGRPMKGRVMATVVDGRVFDFGRDHGLRALRAR